MKSHASTLLDVISFRFNSKRKNKMKRKKLNESKNYKETYEMKMSKMKTK